jgi:tetratricopeptide (TPR) repeat protein
MPFPTDRKSLRRLAAATELTIAATANTDDPSVALKHAQELLRLAEVRRRLGELGEAERLFDESADASLTLGTTQGRDLAAMARFNRAAVALADNRDREAVGIMDRMVELYDGFPAFETLPRPGYQAIALELWQCGFERTKAHEKLYEAAGISLGLLDPARSAAEAGSLARALARRASSADELGYKDEAIETYQRAIPLLEATDLAATDEYLLDRALFRLPELLTELGRDEETTAAYEQMVKHYKGRKGVAARAAVAISKIWLKADRASTRGNKKPHSDRSL